MGKVTRKHYPMYFRHGLGGEVAADVPVKAGYSKAVIVGDIVYLPGMGGLSTETGKVTSDDVLEQTDVAMFKIKSALDEIGLSLDHIIRHEILVKDGEDQKAVRLRLYDFYNKYAPKLKENPPVGTLWVVKGLWDESMKVEIEVTAAVPEPE